MTAALLNCTLGTLGPGVERTIELSARVTQTGTYVNSATGAGDGKDEPLAHRDANNTDDASTLVTDAVERRRRRPRSRSVTPKPKHEAEAEAEADPEHLSCAQGDARPHQGER